MFALRCASLILRSRTDARLPFLRVDADAGGFAIDLPQSWLEDNPLSADALESEAEPLEGGGHEARGRRPVRQEGVRSKASPVNSDRAHHGCVLLVAPRLLTQHSAPSSGSSRLSSSGRAAESPLPRSGWWPTTTTAPLWSGQPARCRMSATRGAGRERLVGLDRTPSASAVCCARTAGLAISANVAGRRCSSHSRDARGLLAALAGQLAREIGHAFFGLGMAPEDQIHGGENTTVKEALKLLPDVGAASGPYDVRAALGPTSRRVAQLVRAPP